MVKSRMSATGSPRTTQVPAIMSPMRRRSRLNKGIRVKMPSHISANQTNRLSMPLRSSGLISNRLAGMKTSISRVTLRAATALGESAPPRRSTTRILNTRLPGVWPRQRSSKAMKKGQRSRNEKIENKARPALKENAVTNTTQTTAIARATSMITRSISRAPARAP